MTKTKIPPLKIQGIKTKIIPHIREQVKNIKFNTWIEPFMGSGIVGFNLAGKKAIFNDINPHLVNFYNAIKKKEISSIIVRKFLESEGKKLSSKGQEYYYQVRERFNENFDPLDFLFLNRCGFNGLIRFNKKLKYNVPFGHKPERFAKAYITKIVNQVHFLEEKIHSNDWIFLNKNFEDVFSLVQKNDFVYCDPPYIGRHVDYYDSWDVEEEEKLKENLFSKKVKFILSTWHSNRYRKNEFIETMWKDLSIMTIEHFYHVGANEKNRNFMLEALLSNYSFSSHNKFKNKEKQQTFDFAKYPLPSKNFIH